MLVYQTSPAPLITAAWLRARLQPVILACKFEKPIPIEIRPTGVWGGWCAAPDSAPDRRVCVSSKVVFWTRERLTTVFLHECGHRLLAGREVANHGPEFFALIAILYTRANQFFDGEAIHFLKLYDFQDVVENHRGEVLDWALKVAEKLAATDKTAEELASEVCQLWLQYVKNKEINELKKAAQVRAQTNLKQEVLQNKSKLFLWRATSASGWSVVLATAYFLFTR